jgi:hypothetical protein
MSPQLVMSIPSNCVGEPPPDQRVGLKEGDIKLPRSKALRAWLILDKLLRK